MNTKKPSNTFLGNSTRNFKPINTSLTISNINKKSNNLYISNCYHHNNNSKFNLSSFKESTLYTDILKTYSNINNTNSNTNINLTNTNTNSNNRIQSFNSMRNINKNDDITSSNTKNDKALKKKLTINGIYRKEIFPIKSKEHSNKNNISNLLSGTSSPINKQKINGGLNTNSNSNNNLNNKESKHVEGRNALSNGNGVHTKRSNGNNKYIFKPVSKRKHSSSYYEDIIKNKNNEIINLNKRIKMLENLVVYYQKKYGTNANSSQYLLNNNNSTLHNNNSSITHFNLNSTNTNISKRNNDKEKEAFSLDKNSYTAYPKFNYQIKTNFNNKSNTYTINSDNYEFSNNNNYTNKISNIDNNILNEFEQNLSQKNFKESMITVGTTKSSKINIKCVKSNYSQVPSNKIIKMKLLKGGENNGDTKVKDINSNINQVGECDIQYKYQEIKNRTKFILDKYDNALRFMSRRINKKNNVSYIFQRVNKDNEN